MSVDAVKSTLRALFEVFGVDALGLRPLWHVETDEEHVFASERGVIPPGRYARDP